MQGAGEVPDTCVDADPAEKLRTQGTIVELAGLRVSLIFWNFSEVLGDFATKARHILHTVGCN